MNEEIESLYSQIAEKAIALIPTKWRKILLYAEILPDVITEAHYFVEADSGEAIQYGDILRAYSIDKYDFNRKSFELTKLIRQMNKEFSNNNQEKWTTITFILESDGQFHIDFGYENLEKTNIVHRRMQWEKKYLSCILNDEELS